jgi:hypothetical protein
MTAAQLASAGCQRGGVRYRDVYAFLQVSFFFLCVCVCVRVCVCVCAKLTVTHRTSFCLCFVGCRRWLCACLCLYRGLSVPSWRSLNAPS